MNLKSDIKQKRKIIYLTLDQPQPVSFQNDDGSEPSEHLIKISMGTFRN